MLRNHIGKGKGRRVIKSKSGNLNILPKNIFKNYCIWLKLPNWIKFTFFFSRKMWASGENHISYRDMKKLYFLCTSVGCMSFWPPWRSDLLLDIVFFVTTLSRNIWQTTSGLRRPVMSYNKFWIIIHSHGGQGEAGSLNLLTIIQNLIFAECWPLTKFSNCSEVTKWTDLNFISLLLLSEE